MCKRTIARTCARIWSCTALTALYAFIPQEAYAYLDPGTGSMLVSALVGILATLVFFLKGVCYKSVSFVCTLLGRTHHHSRESIVLYSEGRQYWNVFRPVVEALSQKGADCTYLTSDDKDPGLSCSLEHVEARCIGKGNKAFATLNMMEADVVCMTTPGLDVLQIHKSKGVGHYAHIVHAAGDVALYRLFGMDYYDSLLSSGPHQEKSIRELERQRKTPVKEIYRCGCSYYDLLMARKKGFERPESDGPGCILVAPTWGPNGLLSLYGMQLLGPLAEAGYKIMVRPHPQSRIVEQDMLKKLQEETARFDNVTWDSNPDNFPAMSQADMMISDYSGIIFDFAFVFERPVLIMDYQPALTFYDAYDIPWEIWDFAAQKEIGRRMKLEDIPRIREIAEEMLKDPGFEERLRRFRDEYVYNFGCAGPVIAERLIALRDRERQKQH